MGRREKQHSSSCSLTEIAYNWIRMYTRKKFNLPPQLDNYSSPVSSLDGAERTKGCRLTLLSFEHGPLRNRLAGGDVFPFKP